MHESDFKKMMKNTFNMLLKFILKAYLHKCISCKIKHVFSKVNPSSIF